MENERNFYPTLELKDTEPKSCEVHFDNNHFGDTERPQGTDTYGLVGELNRWWDNVCTKNGFDPKDKKIKKLAEKNRACH